MSFVHSFDPVSAADSRVLILGSMPGKASLAAGEYYAHPRNLFWRLMDDMLGIGVDQPYSERCTDLAMNGVAVWDVLKSCTRTSSLDSDIVTDSIIVNDFSGFFAAHTGIVAIYFNGAKAASVYERHVLPTLSEGHRAITRIRLPSTSPANASIPLKTKRDAWGQIADLLV